MTKIQFLLNLHNTFDIMGFTYDETNIIIKKILKAGTRTSSKEDTIYE